MEINAYYLHVTIFIVAAVFFYGRFIAAQRERASFQMYKVRDEFIYLVASGVMTETDPVFTYYYKRINSVLSMAPNVGVDDLLNALFNSPKNFDKALEKSRKEAKWILASDSAKTDEVKQTIETYYLGIKHMMLSHSGILRIVFLFTKNFNPLKMLFERFTSQSNPIRGAYIVTEYAEKEAYELHHRGHCHV